MLLSIQKLLRAIIIAILSFKLKRDLNFCDIEKNSLFNSYTKQFKNASKNYAIITLSHFFSHKKNLAIFLNLQ